MKSPNTKPTEIIITNPHDKLLNSLKIRFEKNMNRHKNIAWEDVQKNLNSRPEKIATLESMENTGGEPDVIGYDTKTSEYIFCDCSSESPIGRRNLCYDRDGLNSRKEHKPKDTALDMAAAMNIELLDETQYRELQKLGNFDTKTSSWLKTPAEIRKLDGALFADFRYGKVFVYHNSAPSYYSSRGFRGLVRI